MEDRFNKQKLGKKDKWIILCLVVAAICFFLWFQFGYKKDGNMVRISMGDQVLGEFSLEEDREIPLVIQGETTNILSIVQGKADMIWGNCPDQICVKHRSVSHVGETIVCLPNKIVITVIGEEESVVDSIVK